MCFFPLCTTAAILTVFVKEVETSRAGAAQAFHDDRVVELKVQLGMHEVVTKREKEEQMEVEKEKRIKEGVP